MFSTIWTFITAAFSMVSPYAPLITGVAGTLFGYFWNQYQQHKQRQQNAITTMAQDEDAHASDGAISVGDRQSIQAQDADLNQQLAAIDQQAAQNQAAQAKLRQPALKETKP